MSSGDSGPTGDRRVFRRIHRYGGGDIDLSRWPATVPAVGQILADGLDLGTGVTVLAGENGAGKSTVVEMLAEACGLNPQGGSPKASFRTRDSEPGVGMHLWAERGPGYPAWTYFVRADTMHGLYSYLEENPGRRPERFHELSHGQGFWRSCAPGSTSLGSTSWTNPTLLFRLCPASASRFYRGPGEASSATTVRGRDWPRYAGLGSHACPIRATPARRWR